MPQISELVGNLGEGWKVVGNGQPIEELTSVANPAAGELAPEGTPARTQQGTGRYYVIVQSPEGHQRALYLKASPLKGGLEVPVTGQPLPPKSTAYTGDLRTIDWQQAGAVADLPPTPKEPSPTAQMDFIDAKGKIVPQGDPSATQMRDPKTGTITALVKDAAGVVHDIGDDVVLIKPDGTYTTVLTKPTKPTTQSVPNVGLVEYDPSKPAGQRTSVLIAAPKDPSQQVFKTVNGKTYVYDSGSGNFIESNLPADTEVGYTYNDPNSKWIVFADKQGKEISRLEKPDWKPTPQFQAGQAGAADLVAAKIPTINPTSGALEFVDNQAQVKASEATSQLAQQLGLQVAAGSMSEKQAQDLITNAINAINAQQNLAQTALTATTSGAQTGAGMLNQRVSAGQGMLTSALNLAGQRPMVGLAPGAGQALMQDIQGFTTQLGGGQGVYDTAARLVQAADPSGGTSPMAHAAYGVITQMLDRYRQTAGEPHPYEQATTALQQSQQNNGMAAPGTAPLLSPQAPVSGNPAYASGGPGPVLAGQFTAPPLVAAGQPAPLATNNLTNLDPRLRGAIY